MRPAVLISNPESTSAPTEGWCRGKPRSSDGFDERKSDIAVIATCDRELKIPRSVFLVCP